MHGILCKALRRVNVAPLELRKLFGHMKRNMGRIQEGILEAEYQRRDGQ